MIVKVIKSFLDIPVGALGTITTREGEKLEKFSDSEKAMWIKFDCKDMPVGICLPFGLHVAMQREDL